MIASRVPPLGGSPYMFANVADISDARAPSGHYTVAVKLYAEYTLGRVTVTLHDLKLNGAQPANIGGKG
jgi:hypothetical protein